MDEQMKFRGAKMNVLSFSLSDSKMAKTLSFHITVANGITRTSSSSRDAFKV